MKCNGYIKIFIIYSLVVTYTHGQDVMSIFIRKATKECHSNEFKCKKDLKCVPDIFRCDGTPDCKDETDELMCPKGCGHSSFFCKFSRKCISKSKRCDGKDDCGGLEDETACPSEACKSTEFRCQTTVPECIPMSSVCDRKRHCSDGSDEYKTSCDTVGRKFQVVCEEGSFHCKSDDFCIDREFVCDGNPDCKDESDEDCNANKTQMVEAPAKIECKSGYFKCLSGVCIPNNKTCDGVSDCRESEDEKGCRFRCSENMYQCPDETKCLNSSQICDDKFDCNDKSDERNCTVPTSEVKTTTTSTTTERSPKKCDPKLYFDCDGTGSQCIPLSKVCDDKYDCILNKGSDEKKTSCNRNSCHVNNGGCSHTCEFDFRLKTQTCSCPNGFELDISNNFRCIDIDECKQWDKCSHYCENLNGTFECSCPAGYVKPYENSTRCIVTGEKALMFSSQRDVREYKFSYNELRSVAHGLKNVVGFDIDQTKRPRIIYWSSTSGKIGQMVLASSGPRRKVLVSEENSVPDGLMVDWTNDLLYWTDTGLDRIGVMNLTSGQRTVLLEGKKLDEPRAIVLDPESGLLYWSDWSKDEPKISRMGMNGQNATVLLDKRFVQHPNALALDTDSRRLYYGDAKLGKIGCFDLNTGIHRNIIIDKKVYPFSMIVFEDRIYWSDWRENAVISANKFTGKDNVVVAVTLKPMTLRMINPSVQRRMKGRCHSNNCSHICLPSPEIDLYSCACPVDMRLAKDRTTCIESKTPRNVLIPSKVSPSRKLRKEVYVNKSPDVGLTVGITIGIIVTVAIVALFMGVVLYVKYSRRIRTRTIHFDNAGLIKTSEDLFALTRSNSSMRSMKTVPSSSQPLWTHQTNNDIMDEMMGNDIKV